MESNFAPSNINRPIDQYNWLSAQQNNHVYVRRMVICIGFSFRILPNIEKQITHTRQTYCHFERAKLICHTAFHEVSHFKIMFVDFQISAQNVKSAGLWSFAHDLILSAHKIISKKT